ncbi:MAG: hypothetical protein NTW10_13470 [Bacteroidetes bacterium]|nr:hypothetical protein [Bacteroidota bacterium]
MKKLIVFVSVLIFFASCSKDKENTGSPLKVFRGIVVTSGFGDHLGVWGTEDGDWSYDASWTSQETAVLNFPDSVNLDGTYIDTSTYHSEVIAFPNPTTGNLFLHFQLPGRMKLKTAIVDKNFNRLITESIKWTGNFETGEFLDDATLFPDGIYRLYYSFSATNHVNFYKGHGDILVCRMANWADCQSIVP